MKKEAYQRSELLVTEFEKDADILTSSVFDDPLEYKSRRLKYIDER